MWFISVVRVHFGRFVVELMRCWREAWILWTHYCYQHACNVRRLMIQWITMLYRRYICTVTLRSSAFLGTKWFQALEWKCYMNYSATIYAIKNAAPYKQVHDLPPLHTQHSYPYTIWRFYMSREHKKQIHAFRQQFVCSKNEIFAKGWWLL